MVVAEGYKLAVPGWRYSFPRDHGAHPGFATEWWYTTGHLRDERGKSYGFELTFFRVGVAPHAAKRTSAWAVRDVYFAHLAFTDETGRTFQFADRIRRGSLGDAGAAVGRYSVHVGNWTARQQGNAHILRAAEGGWGLDLAAVPVKPPVIHGRNGVSRKGPGAGRASHYYSLTRMRTTGRLIVDGAARRVSGESWFDHEFGSSQLAPSQVGWDWFSLQMDDETDAMLYLMRDAGNALDPYSSGTLVDSQGGTTHLAMKDFTVQVLDHWHSAASGADYPSAWRITIPRAGWDITLRPTVPDQELRTTRSTGVTYYEGSANAVGTVSGRKTAGRGYVELTGYAGALGGAF